MAILNNSNAISSGAGGYDINNSLRFRSSASAYLSRTQTSGDRQKFTLSVWAKHSEGTFHSLYSSTSGADADYLRFGNVGTGEPGLNFGRYQAPGSGTIFEVYTNASFRDPAAWYHIILAVDTTQATSTNRVKMYVNGTQVTLSGTYPTQNYNLNFNTNAVVAQLGGWTGVGQNWEGNLAEINFVDGQQLTPSSFGETDTDTGSWKPKAYTGTFGTNGFYVKFSDIALTSGSNAGLGKDFSGNGNYWNTNNISVTTGTTYDAMTDVPTNTSATVANYPVINPLTGVTPTGGNLNLSGGDVAGLGTMAFPSTGKWYFEMVCGSGVTTTSLDAVGIGTTDINGTLPANKSVYMYRSNGNKLSIINGGSSTQVSYGATFVNGDVIGVAFDCDADTLSFYKNNTTQGTAFTSILSSTPATPFFLTVYARGLGGTSNVSLNAGQRPFSYTPPTGFVRLNTYNLPDSTIKKGNTVMDATLYTGTGAALNVTNAGGFKPDFVWIKSRSTTWYHSLVDSVRGTNKYLNSNTTDADITVSDRLTSFNSNGFSLGTGLDTNQSSATYVGWQWQAGQGSTSSNTSGSITSTVSVNTTAGFSVVTYTGNGSTTGSTVGHSLGVAPKMIIVKNRTRADNWLVQTASTGATGYLNLDGTGAFTSSARPWNNTAPTSTVFTVNTFGAETWTNKSGDNYVAYCWAEIAGFSKFTSYTGNGSADGPFVYTGFKPAFLMIKRTDSAGGWYIEDYARNPSNVNNLDLQPASSAAEVNNVAVLDFTSNGFKIRNTYTDYNASAGTYIVMAFASNPFKNSNAR